MKIAVSASGSDLEAQVDPRFGRAPFFLIIDTDTMDCKVVPNQPSLQAARGAGVQAAALVARYRPAAVLTGNCGPKAFQTLRAAGIKVIVGATGSIKQAVQNYLAGKFSPALGPNVAGRWR